MKDTVRKTTRHIEIAIEDVAWIKGDNKHKGKWNISIVEELYREKDNIIRAVILPSKNTTIEKPIQFLLSS